MLFNSHEYLLFLPLVFGLYWFVLPATHRARNLLLCGASYVFYGWWDARFLVLIALSSFLDFEVGRALDATEPPGRRKGLLALSLAGNLGMLGVFKYYGFFAASLMEAAAGLGLDLHLPTLRLVLPVGISFYTFQTLSYTIDVYRGRLAATKDRLAFFTYVAFFPQLVAGPIERATHLLGQFASPRIFDDAAARDGCRQMLWGFYKKLVIADLLAPLIDEVFGGRRAFGATLHWFAMFGFIIQLYCDFSGYSDIAIGSARLLGFDLRQNFATPFFSRNIPEFWRRWHISLSTWFRDYLFLPLGGLHGGTWLRVRNNFITFAIIGLWHGANWTFICWGLWNALFTMPYILARGRRRRSSQVVAEGRVLPSLRECLQMGWTFFLTAFAGVFFRSSSLSRAAAFVVALVSPPGNCPCPLGWSLLLPLAAFVTFAGLAEWIMRGRPHALAFLQGELSLPVRWGLYLFIVAQIMLFGGQRRAFVYFQF